jgi:uncharacterized protein (DUF2252 family)
MPKAKRVDRLNTTVRTAAVAARVELGVTARQALPRSSIGVWEPPADRSDPVALLEGQDRIRVPLLVPIRHARMAVSPFTFYRGAATVMASDLGARPNSGLIVQLCGDAHLANFGAFAAPDRSIVFDINDFDETNPGPFEWDVLRLATSLVLAGRDVGLSPEAIANTLVTAAEGYRTQMTVYSDMPDIEVWYDRVSVDAIKRLAEYEGYKHKAVKQIDKSAAKARTRDAWSAISKLTTVVDGVRRFRDKPPILMPIETDDEQKRAVNNMIAAYRDTLPREVQLLMDRYHAIDLAHKLVGVGSVGLIALVILFQGRDPNDLIVLQAKQAVPSVLEQFSGASLYANMGERVVIGQRIMQAASDRFLGWMRSDAGRDLYIRQLRDMKFSPDPSRFDANSLRGYAALCGRTLARAHARAGDPVAISSYLGRSSKFDNAVRDFALAYAHQVEADFAAYKAAIADGSVSVADESKPVDYRVELSSGAFELVDASSGSAST